MKRKYLIQIILLILLFILSISIFNYYYEKNSSVQKNKIDNEEKFSGKTSLSSQQNLIEDIKYTANNTKGDIYEILADYGETSLLDPDLMFLTDVTGNIIFQEKDNIKLFSDFASFNTKTFETTFINNVRIIRGEETITGNELYLVLEQNEELTKDNSDIDENLIRISYNVVFKSPGYTLKADIIEIDLITKNMKIFMNNKLKKVTATGKIK